VPGPRPTSDDWSEPQRRRADRPHASAPPTPASEADLPDGLAWLQDYLGGEPPATQAWPAEPAPTQQWSVEPATGQHDGAVPSPGLPWQADPPTNGQDGSAVPSPGLPWRADRPAGGQANGDAPLPGLPWRAEPPPTNGQYDGAPSLASPLPWSAEPATGQHDGAAGPSQPWSAAPPPSEAWGIPVSPSLPKGMESPPDQLWSTDPQPGQAQDVRPTQSAAEFLRAHRIDPLADAGGRPRRDGTGRRGPVAIAIAIPLIISLLLIVTAGPGRILPTRGKQAAAKRPVAAPVPSGGANRLVSLINRERARNGLPGFLVLRRLNAVAAAHSAEMASQKRIHADPNVAANARPATSVSEYVDCASNVDQVYRRIMASATFRPKVLSPDLNGIGMGTVSGNCLWVTVLFARATPPASAAKPASPVGGGPSTQTSPSAPTATTRPAPAAPAPARPSSTADAIARDLFSRVNAERKARGLAPLSWNGDLARLATDWSGQMARTNQFVHRDLDAARSKPGIGQFSALAENIAWVRGYADDAYELHRGWMRSDGHRHNLLQPGFDSIGIGVVCSGGRAWATQNFGRLSASTPALSDSVPATEPIVATAKDGLTC
jgi:uncharacterized protein YkwD